MASGLKSNHRHKPVRYASVNTPETVVLSVNWHAARGIYRVGRRLDGRLSEGSLKASSSLTVDGGGGQCGTSSGHAAPRRFDHEPPPPSPPPAAPSSPDWTQNTPAATLHGVYNQFCKFCTISCIRRPVYVCRGGIMFSTCPSLRACVRAGAFPTGFPSTSS